MDERSKQRKSEDEMVLGLIRSGQACTAGGIRAKSGIENVGRVTKRLQGRAIIDFDRKRRRWYYVLERSLYDRRIVHEEPSMVVFVQGNLFSSDAEAWVNPVNCKGVMGKGLAANFKFRFPGACESYIARCAAGRMRIGDVETAFLGAGHVPKWILHIPTKDDWRQPSQLTYVSSALQTLKKTVRELEISSVAVPALGCGAGGLLWPTVRAIMKIHLEDDESPTRWQVYDPHG